MSTIVAIVAKRDGHVMAGRYSGRGRDRREIHKVLGYQAKNFPQQYLVIVSPQTNCGGATTHREMLDWALESGVLSRADDQVISSDGEPLTLIATATFYDNGNAIHQVWHNDESIAYFDTEQNRRWLVARPLGHFHNY